MAGLKLKNTDVGFDYAEIEKAAGVLRAVKHPLRQEMLALINEKETTTVTDLYEKLNIEQSVASSHLGILRRAGIVATERQGKFIYYRVDKERIGHVNLHAARLNAVKA